MKFYCLTNTFHLNIFDKERVGISTEMHFVSLYFLNERNLTTSLLMMHLKNTVVHYDNLNLGSINKLILNYGLLNIRFRFLRFLSYIYFNEAFWKKNFEMTIIFITNIQNSFQDVEYCTRSGCQTLWY